MKAVLSFIFIITSCYVYGQNYKLHQNIGGNYQMNIPVNSQIKLRTNPNGFKEDFTVFNNNNSVRYLMNVIRVEGIKDSYDFLLSKDYKNNYLRTCSCSITEVSEVIFNDIRGVKYYYKIDTGQNIFLGYFISFIDNYSLYTITYNTIQKNFKLFESEFQSILESVTIND